MEPVFGVETYAKCWQSTTNRNSSFEHSLYLLDMVAPQKRKLIAEALKIELELRPGNILRRDKDEVDTGRVKGLQMQIDSMIVEIDGTDSAGIIKDIKRYRDPSHIMQWLVDKRAGHVAGEVMAKSEDVMLRQRAVELLKAHPTVERMELLKELAGDADDFVSSAASEALKELDKIRMEVWK
jgi:hypothetical protein